jgi:hypothetical protein
MSIKRSPNTVKVSYPYTTCISSSRRCLIMSTYKRAYCSKYIRLRRSSYSIEVKTKMSSLLE